MARQVHAALAPLVGRPLVGLDGSAVLAKVDALPTVVSASYDRDFPHTLRVIVVAERPAAVLRRGADSWLLSTRGPRDGEPLCPPPQRSCHESGSRRAHRCGRAPTSPRPVRATAAHAAGLAGAFGPRVDSVSYTDGSVVFHLRSGVELLLGNGSDIKLKVAVAERVLPLLPPGSTYLDVSTPGRPVSGTGSPLVVSTKSSSRG